MPLKRKPGLQAVNSKSTKIVSKPLKRKLSTRGLKTYHQEELESVPQKERLLNTATLGQKKKTNTLIKEVDYSIRYAKNWSSISLQCKQLTKFKCCYPGCHSKCVETHHSLYYDKQGAIAGRELPGIHVFPLCDTHHKLAHKKSNWITNKSNPELGNKNTSGFYLVLRNGWLERRQ